jgi:uncharacterized protein involved in type VI secretion and phage assembly
MAGPNRGTFFIPQIGDEVLVSFNQGDVSEAYVIGSLWNGRDQPPTQIPTDAVSKRLIRTPVGHEVVFDDLGGSIEVKNGTGQQIRLERERIVVETLGGTARITLQATGSLTIEADLDLTIKGKRKVSIVGSQIEIKSDARTNINGGTTCDIQAALVKIN